MNRCIDCQACQQPQHYLKCVFNDKDDIAMVFNKMREADIILYSTPVYVFENVYDSYIQAGRELVLTGRISNKTQKNANQSMVKIPFFIKTMLKLGFGKDKVLEAHNNTMKNIIQRT